MSEEYTKVCPVMSVGQIHKMISIEGRKCFRIKIWTGRYRLVFCSDHDNEDEAFIEASTIGLLALIKFNKGNQK